mmetsp:Transcript_97609/g.315146  ORF Transcript_97609/g.315146 Transcript_97609/m.315146 type:complete len:228 (+) Transcript_97609:907-1590(+)
MELRRGARLDRGVLGNVGQGRILRDVGQQPAACLVAAMQRLDLHGRRVLLLGIRPGDRSITVSSANSVAAELRLDPHSGSLPPVLLFLLQQHVRDAPPRQVAAPRRLDPHGGRLLQVTLGGHGRRRDSRLCAAAIHGQASACLLRPHCVLEAQGVNIVSGPVATMYRLDPHRRPGLQQLLLLTLRLKLLQAPNAGHGRHLLEHLVVLVTRTRHTSPKLPHGAQFGLI